YCYLCSQDSSKFKMGDTLPIWESKIVDGKKWFKIPNINTSTELWFVQDENLPYVESKPSSSGLPFYNLISVNIPKSSELQFENNKKIKLHTLSEKFNVDRGFNESFSILKVSDGLIYFNYHHETLSDCNNDLSKTIIENNKKAIEFKMSLRDFFDEYGFLKINNFYIESNCNKFLTKEIMEKKEVVNGK
ncbi:MAG: hypothetical protein K2Q18_07475, partial [Bdellovibrionales bacterium]|nr:hypothetical protein [Bdellovibrionales bacterium]